MRGAKNLRAENAYAFQQPAVDWMKVGLVVFTIAALSLLMSVHLMPDKIALHLGDVSPREVRASRSVTYPDSVAFAHRQQVAMLATPASYDIDNDAAGNANRIVQEFFDRIERERATHRFAKTPILARQTAELLQAQLGSMYTRSEIIHLLTAPPAIVQKLRSTTARLISDAMDREIREPSESVDLFQSRRDVANAARATLSPESAAVVQSIAIQALRPNRLLNRHKTELQREAAARAVRPVFAHIQYGDLVIGKGETVTPEHLDKFMALGLLNPHLEPTTGVAICVLAAAMVFLVVFHISRVLPLLYADRRRLTLLAIIVLLSVFGLKVGASMFGLSFSGGQAGYLGMMSVAAAGMLVSVLLDRNLAILVVALLSVLSGLIMNHEIRFTVMTLMGSLVGISAVNNARRKTNLLTATVALSGANLAMVWLLGLLLRDSLSELLTGSAWAVGAAAFATFLYWFGVLALEKPFGILTHTTLLEMSSFDRPLLAHLCAVAPGTYAHSIMVGTLAEAGAQAIGADALLCRVGGCYHDIGKTKNPEFFVENQRRENVHCRLSPSLSSLIIIGHVKEGMLMAKEHRLPQEICDIIAQHHGTTLIRYFYRQALTDCGGSEEVPPGLEERFRYSGPKPQTREAALVMLADSVEAAARSQDKPSPEALQSLIATIFRDKIEDGQLDECDLTFRDLKGISTAFLHVLTAMMHGRIGYPPLPVTRAGTGKETGTAELTPEIAASLAQVDVLRNDIVFGEAQPERERTLLNGNALDSARPLEYSVVSESVNDSLPAHHSPMVPLEEPEVFYGRLPAKHAPDPDKNESSPSGSAPPARGGRPRPRRS